MHCVTSEGPLIPLPPFFTVARFRFCGVLLALALAPLVSASPALDAAVALVKAHRYPEAQTALEAVAAAEPASAAAPYYLGVLALRRDAPDAAIPHLQRATELDPQNSRYFAELGAAYGAAALHAGLFEKASLAEKCRDALLRAVALDPDNLDARDGLVSFYRQAPGFVGGGLDKAYAQAAEIRARDPVRGTLILAQLDLKQKRTDAALTRLDEVLRDHPDAYDVLYNFGRIAAETGQRLAPAERHLRHCLTLAPTRNQPSHAAVHWRLGQLAERRSDPAAARAEYEAALQLDPNFQPAQTALTH